MKWNFLVNSKKDYCFVFFSIVIFNLCTVFLVIKNRLSQTMEIICRKGIFLPNLFILFVIEWINKWEMTGFSRNLKVKILIFTFNFAISHCFLLVLIRRWPLTFDFFFFNLSIFIVLITQTTSYLSGLFSSFHVHWNIMMGVEKKQEREREKNRERERERIDSPITLCSRGFSVAYKYLLNWDKVHQQ